MTIKCSFFNACYYARCAFLPIHSLHSFDAVFYVYEMILHNGVCLLTQQHNHFNISISDKQLMDISDTRNFLFTIFQIKALQWPSTRRNHSIHKHTRKQNKKWLFWLECLNLLRYWFQCYSIYSIQCILYTLIRVSVNDRWWFSFPLYIEFQRGNVSLHIQFWHVVFSNRSWLWQIIKKNTVNIGIKNVNDKRYRPYWTKYESHQFYVKMTGHLLW